MSGSPALSTERKLVRKLEEYSMVTKARIQREVQVLLSLPGANVRPVPVELIAQARQIELVREPLKSDEDDVSGFYFREGERRVIGVNSAHAPVRQRFTVAHELGHAVLHDEQGLHLDQAFRLRDRRSSMAVDADEIAANRFAAELLMPEHEVLELVSASGMDLNDETELLELARHFGVSPQAFTYRLANLGVFQLDGVARF
jgi:Zn-dependent peptidase ImmA (M78 family)